MASASPSASASSEPAAAPEVDAPAAALPAEGPTEIAFFDVETSVPQRAGQGYALLEFGAILVCPRRLVEVASYATLVRPADPASAVSAASVRCNGITRDAVSAAPPFRDVADAVYDLLNGEPLSFLSHAATRSPVPFHPNRINSWGYEPHRDRTEMATFVALLLWVRGKLFSSWQHGQNSRSGLVLINAMTYN